MISSLAKRGPAGLNGSMNSNENIEETPEREGAPKIKAIGDPISVPVFNCVVYILRDDDGVSARVANLEGIEFRGNSEPEVLRRVVTAFKECVASLHGNGETIPWIDPPARIEAGEQQRLIPVHL